MPYSGTKVVGIEVRPPQEDGRRCAAPCDVEAELPQYIRELNT